MVQHTYPRDANMFDQWISRRRVLKHAGIVGILGLSGCTTFTDGSPPSGRRITDLSVNGLDSDPISVTANASSPRITSEQTAQLELTVTVERDGPVSLSFGNSIPFHYPEESTPQGLKLLPGGQQYGFERASQETWIPAESFIAPDSAKMLTDMSAGDSLTQSWEVWGDPDHVSFIEPGTYEFRSEIGVDPPGEDFEWMLSLTIATESPEE